MDIHDPMNTDNILGFLCAVVAHIIGLLVIGGGVLPNEADETPPVLNTMTLELSLVEEDVPAELPSTGPVVSAPEPPPPTPEPETPPEPETEPEPEPIVPPPPEPDPEPVPVLQPEPEPEAIILPEPPPKPEPQPEEPPPPEAEDPDPEPDPEPQPPPLPQPPAETPPAPGPPPVAAVPEGTALTTIQPGPAAAGDGGTVAQGQVTAPTTGDRPIKPKYPTGSRSRGEEGSVVFDVLVSKDGRAKTVTLVASSHFPELDHSAKRAVSQARFVPGTRNGKPAESTARLTIIFRLNDP